MQYPNSLKFANMAAVLTCSLAFTLLFALPQHAVAQSPGVRATPASSAFLVRLPGHMAPEVLNGTATRVGHYDPDQKLRLAVVLALPHPVEEQQFLEAIQDKTSPLFHQFLTQEEWNARFGPSAESEQAVVDWAESQGLTVSHRYNNRLVVDLEAPAGTIEKALNLTINSYQLPASQRDEARIVYSNDREPSVPANLGGVVDAILGLNSIVAMRPAGGSGRLVPRPDYSPGPVALAGDSLQKDASNEPPPASAAGGDPTSGTSTPNGYDPRYFWNSDAYNYQALMNQGHCCNPTNTASHSPRESSIAIASFADVNFNDINAFQAYFSYLATDVDKILIDGAYVCNNNPNPDDGCSEVTMDTEWSLATANSQGSVASTARVVVYEGFNYVNSTIMDLYNQMEEDAHARTMTTSWGIEENVQYSTNPELDTYNTTMQSIDKIFSSMAGQGWTLVAASGDQGATGGCTDALAVQFPSSDPNVVAAGGTELDEGNPYEVAWTGGTFKGTATQSDSCGSNQGGSTGGFSEYFPSPGFQSGMGFAKRAVPDLALDTTHGHDVYFLGSWGHPGGTSVAAPMLAGFFAQANAYLLSVGNICGSKGDSACAPIGNANYPIYEEGLHHNAAHNPFYDITSGCNTNDLTIKYKLKAYCAGPGYDEVTGWGSANMLQFAWAINWEIIPASGEPYITWSGPATNKWYNTNQTVSWTIHDYRPAGSTPGTGIAGETQGWDSLASDPTSEPHGGSGNSFYDGPQFPNGKTGCLAFEPNGCSGGVSQGCHTARARGWNNQGWSTAGNSSYPESYGPICYDTVPPTIAAVYKPASPNANGWYTGPVTITLTASDPGGSGASGVEHIYDGIGNNACKTDSPGNCATYGSGINLNTDQVASFTAFSEDKAGNFSTVINKVIQIDSTPPATTAGFNGVLTDFNYWTNTVTIVLKATDNLSGVAETYYTLDGGAKIKYSSPFKISTVGTHTLDYWSVDKAGNTEKANSDVFQIASSTTVTLTGTPNPSAIGQIVTLKATVTATDPGTPTGTVTFLMGSTKLGAAVLAGGMATMTTSALPAGSDSLAVTFNGALTNYLSSTSAVLNQVVHEATTTTLTAAPSPAAYGSPVTLTATVTPSISGTATGSVRFLDGPNLIGTATLNGSGVASIAASALAVGSNSITASYAGDTTYLTSMSKAVAEIINKAASATALKTSTNSSAYEEIVSLTATVTSAGGTPTGFVNFLSNGKSVGIGTLADGVASLVTKALPVGTDSVTASYEGSADFTVSTSSAVSVAIGKSPTTTRLASSLNPTTVGASVTFTATVISAIGPAPGTVTFMDGDTSLGSGTLIGGKATLATTKLTEGTHSITSEYDGSADYASSSSAALTQTVNASTAASRVVYVPDYYGQLLQVRVGTGTTATAITIDLPSCNPNSVAVNSNKAYVVCNANGDNPDKILVYDATTIRAAAAGTLSISPLQTITSTQFNSLIGIAFDASNNLWVASYGNSQVDEITAAALGTATPTVTASLINSPGSPVALAFDKDGSLWVTGQYAGGILVNFPSSQLGQGVNAIPDYCAVNINFVAGCENATGLFLNPEGLALFNGDVWVANNATGAGGNVPGRELLDFTYSGGSAATTGTLTLNATFGNSGVAADSPFVCPGGLFAGSVHLWVNDESYGENNPQCGAAGDVASGTGGVFDFTADQLTAKTTTINQVLAYSNITGRPGFGGIFVENDQ